MRGKSANTSSCICRGRLYHDGNSLLLVHDKNLHDCSVRLDGTSRPVVQLVKVRLGGRVKATAANEGRGAGETYLVQLRGAG
eukprot:11651653-Karenia_brevis.AAC.1